MSRTTKSPIVRRAARSGAEVAYGAVAERVRALLQTTKEPEAIKALNNVLEFAEGWQERWDDESP